MICELALVLMLDASGSIEPPDWNQQVHQTANAIRSEEVISAIERAGPVAIMAAGFSTISREMVGWQVLRTREDALRMAAALEAAPRPTTGFTSIGNAMSFGVRQLANTPCTEVTQQIIDISTDGVTSESTVAALRDEAQSLGVRINVIGVGNFDMSWLRENVVTMDGFLIEATGWDEYPQRFRRKIILEFTERRN